MYYWRIENFNKINVIINLIKKINNLIIVGAMANNFFVYKNFKVGKSLVEINTKEVVKKIYEEAIKIIVKF